MRLRRRILGALARKALAAVTPVRRVLDRLELQLYQWKRAGEPPLGEGLEER